MRNSVRTVRHLARNLTAATVIAAMPATTVPSLLQPRIRLASYDVVNTAAIDQRNTAVGISDPYLSYPWNYETAQDVNDELALMSAMGVTNVRIQIPWSLVQPDNPNQYDWSRIDAVVAAAAKRKIGVLAILSDTPGWAGDPPTSGEPDPGAFAAFVGKVARRYDGKIAAYEVWNEPNQTTFLDPNDPVAYTALLKAAYGAIKQVDPTLLVVGGVVAAAVTQPGSLHPVEFVQGMYEAGAAGFFDALSFHPYAYPLGSLFSAGQGWPNSSFSQLAVLRQLMVENGDQDKTIWATEFGAPTAGGITAQTQAEVIADFLSTWSQFGYTGPMFVHSMRDLAETADAEDSFGIFDYQGQPKPGAYVVKDWNDAHALTPFQAFVVAMKTYFHNMNVRFKAFLQKVANFWATIVRPTAAAVAPEPAAPSDVAPGEPRPATRTARVSPRPSASADEPSVDHTRSTLAPVQREPAQPIGEKRVSGRKATAESRVPNNLSTIHTDAAADPGTAAPKRTPRSKHESGQRSVKHAAPASTATS